jgi:hypothetical protein
MYPVLVATGGITTFLWDVRHRILAHVRPRRHRRSSSAISPETNGSIELQAVPSTPVDVAVPPLARTREASTVDQDDGKTGKETSVESGLRQRSTALPVSPTPPTETAPSDERLRTRLIVPPTRVAYTFGGTFIALVILLVVLRGKYPVKPVPRALDFTTNMVIAGVIIFGVRSSFEVW